MSDNINQFGERWNVYVSGVPVGGIVDVSFKEPDPLEDMTLGLSKLSKSVQKFTGNIKVAKDMLGLFNMRVTCKELYGINARPEIDRVPNRVEKRYSKLINKGINKSRFSKRYKKNR